MTTRYIRLCGAMFRCIINDLKRNDVAAAEELGIPLEQVCRIISGEEIASQSVIAKAVEIWPVNERDFLPVHDDTNGGVVVVTADESRASSRRLSRGGTEYYEYRDTAMTRLALIRPEWIKMLQVVDNDSPDNTAVQWNNGHILYQFTYFIGPVTFYYSYKGKKLVSQMNTGDSAFILPFVPHSFACRSNVDSGVILALTFGGRLCGDAQHELGALGSDLEGFCITDGNRPVHVGDLIKIHMINSSVSLAHLAERSSIKPALLEDMIRGTCIPTGEDLIALAKALVVSVRDLMPSNNNTDNGVVLCKGDESLSWYYPDGFSPAYRIRNCANATAAAFSRSLEVELIGGGGSEERGIVCTGLHEYGFNHGSEPVLLTWLSGDLKREAMIYPECSYYIKPFIRHWFSVSNGQRGRLIVLRVGTKIAGDGLCEAATIGVEGIRRVAFDDGQWYNTK